MEEARKREAKRERESERVKERNREETLKRYGTGMKTIRRRETDLSAARKERRRRREGWHTPDATALRHRRAQLVPFLPFRVDAARAFSALRVSAKRTHARYAGEQLCPPDNSLPALICRIKVEDQLRRVYLVCFLDCCS